MADPKKATARPWHGDPEPYCEYIWGPENEMVAQVRGYGADLPREANAALILEAVNGREDARKLAEAVAAMYTKRHDAMADEDPLWGNDGGELTVGDLRRAKRIMGRE